MDLGADGPGGLRAVIAALAANLGIAAVKLVAFAFTGSASMLAESAHSLADSGNEVLLLFGRSRAQRSQTEEHPFGFGRERYFYAFIVAVVLFTVGALFSLNEGIHKITQPGAGPLARGRVRRARHRHGPGELLAAHRPCASRRPNAAGSAGPRSSAGPRPRNCPPCCWRTWPRWPGWSSRRSA